jgi:hypothetical protein
MRQIIKKKRTLDSDHPSTDEDSPKNINAQS